MLPWDANANRTNRLVVWFGPRMHPKINTFRCRVVQISKKKKPCRDDARALYLYCCLVSHLPAFVSRSLVARTLIMFRNSTKLTCREKKTPGYLSTSAHNEIIRFLVLCRCTETALLTSRGDDACALNIYSPLQQPGWALDKSISNCPHLSPNTCDGGARTSTAA